MDKSQIYLRGARDRLIDLLGIGETYPIQDVQVVDERITVPINSTAKIQIFPGQTDVRYKLCDAHERPLDKAAGLAGNGEVTVLETPAISEDLTFRLLARKIDSGREAFLHQSAAVKVGLDATLSARIVNAELLLQTQGLTADSTPRIVHYGSDVSVEVDRSQEGVDYELVHMVAGGPGVREVVVSARQVRGNLRTIALSAGPFFEDTEIRIRATKRFDPSEHREPQTTLLNAVLPLAVRANPAVEPRIAGSPVIDFGAKPKLTLSKTQTSVQYRLHARTLEDGDFLYGPVRATAAVAVPVPGGGVVQVAKPPVDRIWATPGFSNLGEPQQGNGGEIEWALGEFVEDTIFVVEATKRHAPGGTSSSVQVAAPAVVLVRPNPEVRLSINAHVDATAARGPFLITGGDAGVFYFLGEITPLPAYFHKVDAADRQSNKGVGQLRIGVDLVVTRSPQMPVGADLARVRPLDPLVETAAVTLPATLAVRAVKARTQVEASVNGSVTIAAPPPIKADTVELGSPAKIVVSASRTGEVYQLFSEGQAVGEGLAGTGSDLELPTAPLTADTDFEVRVTRPTDPEHEVIAKVLLTVRVKAAS